MPNCSLGHVTITLDGSSSIIDRIEAFVTLATPTKNREPIENYHLPGIHLLRPYSFDFLATTESC